MHALTSFRSLAYDASKVERTFKSLINRQDSQYVFLVAQGADSRIVGTLIGSIEQHIFSEALVASVIHIDVLPEARAGGYAIKLLRAFEGLCGNRGVVEISVGVNSEDGEVGGLSFLERIGYRTVGANYSRQIGSPVQKIEVAEND